MSLSVARTPLNGHYEEFKGFYLKLPALNFKSKN